MQQTQARQSASPTLLDGSDPYEFQTDDSQTFPWINLSAFPDRDVKAFRHRQSNDQIGSFRIHGHHHHGRTDGAVVHQGARYTASLESILDCILIEVVKKVLNQSCGETKRVPP